MLRRGVLGISEWNVGGCNGKQATAGWGDQRLGDVIS